MPATKVYAEQGEKPDGSRYEMVAWAVPKSPDYPEGIRYSLQYMAADGTTLLRFDNTPHHLDVGRHHRHTLEGKIEALNYSGLRPLVAKFLTEVNEIYERRTE